MVCFSKMHCTIIVRFIYNQYFLLGIFWQFFSVRNFWLNLCKTRNPEISFSFLDNLFRQAPFLFVVPCSYGHVCLRCFCTCISVQMFDGAKSVGICKLLYFLLYLVV